MKNKNIIKRIWDNNPFNYLIIAFVMLVAFLYPHDGENFYQIFCGQTIEERNNIDLKYWSKFRYKIGDKVKLTNGNVGTIIKRQTGITHISIISLIPYTTDEGQPCYMISYFNNNGEKVEDIFMQSEL